MRTPDMKRNPEPAGSKVSFVCGAFIIARTRSEHTRNKSCMLYNNARLYQTLIHAEVYYA